MTWRHVNAVLGFCKYFFLGEKHFVTLNSFMKVKCYRRSIKESLKCMLLDKLRNLFIYFFLYGVIMEKV